MLVTVSRRRSSHTLTTAVLGLIGVLMLALPGVALAGTTHATKLVRYHGYSVTVPAGWPVVNLAQRPHACVRFDRHAVYLGDPGARQDCPPHAAGRTEALLVSPLAHGARGAVADGRMLAPSSPTASSASGGSVARLVKPAARVVVTATWNRDPGAIRSALGMRSLASAARAYAGARPTPAAAAFRPAAVHAASASASRAASASASRAATASSVAPAAGFPTTGPGVGSPGATYTGLGFDACSTPSSSTLAAWGSSPFHALGVYIGGANMACSQPNLTASWVTAESAAGWHLVPIYVGLQAPSSGCGCATISSTSASAEGAAAAQDAIVQAQALGLGEGNPIYDDMESYARGSSSSTVLAFLQGWTTQLHDSGYVSGVYSSAASGIEDLVAHNGTGYTEPDDIWIADWNGQQNTAEPVVPASEWAAHQRLHQYRGGHTDDYGGAQISIDTDYLDGATAAAGTLSTTIAAAPSIAVHPAPDGTIELSPRWSGEQGVSSWQILAGSSPSALTPSTKIHASAHLPVVLRSSYRYFQVQALDDAGQQIAASPAVRTPDHVAIFGNSSFVPANGPGGLPVACFGGPACRVTTTISSGKTRLAQTRLERVPAGGGVVYYSLSRSAHRLLAHAPGRRLPVTVTVRSSAGARATRQLNLIPFTTSGRAPRKRHGSSPALRIIGVTDFVSHGWTGGVLAACASRTPCSATTTVTAGGGRVIAPARAQTLGAGEVGYLSFRLTGAGHAMLRATRGNQLGVGIHVTTAATAMGAATTASALVALDSFS